MTSVVYNIDVEIEESPTVETRRTMISKNFTVVILAETGVGRAVAARLMVAGSRQAIRIED